MTTPPAIKAMMTAPTRARTAARRVPAGKVLPGWPTEARNAAARERAAIRNALTDVVGADEAERLIGIADALPPEEPLPEPSGNAWTRAEALTETAVGRARLKTLTWETV